MKQKQHGKKQRIRGDSKCPINKDGVMAENSKWLDIYLCGPQTPASRVNQLVKHGTGSQSLFPLCLFSIFFLHPGCLGFTSSCNGQDISIHHPSLSKTYSTIPWRVEEIGKEAWCFLYLLFPLQVFFPLGHFQMLMSVFLNAHLGHWICFWVQHTVLVHICFSLIQCPLRYLALFLSVVSPSISRTKWEERACYFWFTHAQRYTLSSK